MIADAQNESAPRATSVGSGNVGSDHGLRLLDNSISESDGNVNTAGEKSPAVKSDFTKPYTKIAEWVNNRLNDNLPIDFKDLQVVSNDAYNGTMADGTYSVKDMTDALGLGVNRHVIDLVSKNLSDFTGDANNAADSIDHPLCRPFCRGIFRFRNFSVFWRKKC